MIVYWDPSTNLGDLCETAHIFHGQIVQEKKTTNSVLRPETYQASKQIQKHLENYVK